VFIEAKDDGSGGDNWIYKSCTALVKSSPTSNYHPTFANRMAHPDGWSQPNQQHQIKALKGNLSVVIIIYLAFIALTAIYDIFMRDIW